MPSAQVIVKSSFPGVKGPVIVTVLSVTVATPVLTVMSSGGLSKVRVMVSFVVISTPLTGSVLTTATNGLIA